MRTPIPRCPEKISGTHAAQVDNTVADGHDRRKKQTLCDFSAVPDPALALPRRQGPNVIVRPAHRASMALDPNWASQAPNGRSEDSVSPACSTSAHLAH